jgi:hypothetical protein
MELKERSSGGKNAIEMFLSGKSNSVLYPWPDWFSSRRLTVLSSSCRVKISRKSLIKSEQEMELTVFSDVNGP